MKTKKIANPSNNSLNGEELPEGWSEVSLSKILSALESGSRPKGGVRGIENGIPSVGGEHLNDSGGFRFENIKYIPMHFFENMRRGKIQTDDILIVKDGATTGKVSLVRSDFPYNPAMVNEHVFVCRFVEEIYSPFVFYFLFSQVGQNRILENFQGSAQGGINQTFAKNTIVPIAPYDEQQRIVARVEALLTQVNAAHDRLSRVPLIMKRFRQGVLTAACSGRLTEGWREENPDEIPAIQLLQQIKKIRQGQKNQNAIKRANKIQDKEFETTQEDTPDIPDTWAWCQIQDIAQVHLGGTPSRKESTYWDGTISWISSGEVANNRIQTTREKITESGLQNSSAKIYPTGTVLIAMIGEGKTRGQSAMLDIEAATNQNVAGLVFDTDKIFNEFVWLWALSQYEKTRAVGRGGEQPALNGDKVRNLVLALPPLTEQHEIVRRVGLLFERADAVDREVAAASRRCERLTHVVLGKAFRGEF